MNKKMRWKNLAQNKCPQCNKEFTDFAEPGYIKSGCGFVITTKRFTELTEKMASQTSPDYGVDNVDNQAALNSF